MLSVVTVLPIPIKPLKYDNGEYYFSYPLFSWVVLPVTNLFINTPIFFIELATSLEHTFFATFNGLTLKYFFFTSRSTIPLFSNFVLKLMANS